MHDFSYAQNKNQLVLISEKNASSKATAADILSSLEQNEQTEAINAFGKERKQYQQKIQNLEKKLGDASIKSVDASLNAGIADDLKRINGIGSMTEETLNDFGIYNFTQLATISEDNKALLSQVISSTPDKITNWAEAAQKLLEIK